MCRRRPSAATWWHNLKRRHPPLRKGTSLLKQLPRFASHVGSGRLKQPTVLVNSFPKSGTHLLVQVLEALPNTRNYDSFIASIPPIRFRERSERTLQRRIGWVVPGELVSAHLHFSAGIAEALAKANCIHFLIYRDLRDVVISEAHYLTYMNRWHRAHGYFARLPSDADRILTAIRGIPHGSTSFVYPSVVGRFAPFKGWFQRDDTCTVRFEDIVGANRNNTMQTLAQFYESQSGIEMQRDQVVADMIANIDPTRSRTFREGRAGSWREVFTEAHKVAMKEIAGQLLIELGYEADLSW